MSPGATSVPSPARSAHRPWWQDAVVYECHLPSFRDGDGDGIGDLAGLAGSLDYLAGTLGVDAVWTGPFYRSPLLDQGFDLTDHEAVEPIFGDLAAVDRLLTEAHARGLRIIVDFVPNHTSDRHPWFAASRSSRADPKRDWYVWADPGPDGGPPNNWVAESGGSSWQLDQRTGQYYLHSHLREQPDLNWRNPAVRRAMLAVMRFWLERGVDGFRIDVAHMLMKDPELGDNPPSPDGHVNAYDIQHADFHSQLHVNDRMHPDLDGVLREIRAVLDEYEGERVAIAEVEAMGWDRWTQFFGTELDAVHLPFAFHLIETPWAAPDLERTLAGLYAHIPPGGWPALALGNHDRRRLVSRIGAEQARVAALLLLTVPGTPTIFYGDELGLPDQEVPRERGRDHFAMTVGGVSRDPTRTPMPWSAARNGGFSSAAAQDLWLPVLADYERLNVESQLEDPASLLNLYRSVLSLRRAGDALRQGELEVMPTESADCLVYERRTAAERKLVALNLGGSAARMQVPVGGSVVLSTDPGRAAATFAGELELGPNEGLIATVEHG